MSACAIPVDWRVERAVATVSSGAGFNVAQLAEDFEMDIEETMDLLVQVGFQFGIPVSFVDTSHVVLH